MPLLLQPTKTFNFNFRVSITSLNIYWETLFLFEMFIYICMNIHALNVAKILQTKCYETMRLLYFAHSLSLLWRVKWNWGVMDAAVNKMPWNETSIFVGLLFSVAIFLQNECITQSQRPYLPWWQSRGVCGGLNFFLKGNKNRLGSINTR